MKCDEALENLNALADGELPEGDAAKLEAHLAECSACRAEADAIQSLNAELRLAFVPQRQLTDRLTENVVAALRTAAVVPAPVAARPVSVPRFSWFQALACLAAGFLLAVALFQPWKPQGSATTGVAITNAAMRNTCARVTATSAPVEVWTTPQDAFRCPSFGEIRRDSFVRTGPDDRCEIALDNGNAIRLDCDTEVKLVDSENVTVNRGRMWSTSAPGGKRLEIEVYGCPVETKSNEWAQLAVNCQPQWAQLVVVSGTANVQSGTETIQVGANQRVRIADGKVQNAPEWCDTTLETAWVNNVLALSDSDHPELLQRVNQLLANVGAAKLSLMYEDELRRLGDAGVPPLLAYLASTRATPDVAQRVTAARICADVAETRWIGDLIALLTDPNAEVRVHAARGLSRLTGRDQGLAATTWQSPSWASCETGYDKWLRWWTENRDRYPGARREVPVPTTPPF